MKKKMACWLLIFLMLLSCAPAQGQTSAETDSKQWVLSEDGTVEARFVSFEESAYPTYKLTLQFRIDQSQESDERVFNFDFSNKINQYIAENSTDKNRKVKVTCSGEIKKIVCENGTNYAVWLPCTVGGKESVNLCVHEDLARIFPDDFVNSDALCAAACLKIWLDIKGISTGYDFSDFKMMPGKDENVRLYIFDFTASNRAGGKTTMTMYASYNISDGSAAFIDENNNPYFRGDNAPRGIRLLQEVNDQFDQAIKIPASSIQSYLK